MSRKWDRAAMISSAAIHELSGAGWSGVEKMASRTGWLRVSAREWT